MASANLADSVIQTIDNTSQTFVQNVYMALTSEINVVIGSLILITIILFGLFLIMGWIEYPVREFAKKIVIIVSILALVNSWPYFHTFFYSMFTDGPDELAEHILIYTGYGNPGSTSSKLGSMLTHSFEIAEEIFEADGWFMPYVLGVLCILCCMAYCVYAIAIISIAKIGTACVLAVGPLFIVFLMFSATKQMFASWLQQLFHFAFMVLITYIVIVFFMSMYQGALNSIPDQDIGLGDVVPLLVVSIIGMLVLAQVQSIASGLAGGAQLGTLGAFAATGRRLRNVDWKNYSGPRGSSGSTKSQAISRR